MTKTSLPVYGARPVFLTGPGVPFVCFAPEDGSGGGGQEGGGGEGGGQGGGDAGGKPTGTVLGGDPGPGADNGGGGGGQPGSGGDQGQAPADPFAALDEENRTWVANKGWKGTSDVIQSYRALEQAQGSKIAVPAADAPQAEWDAFYDKAGRPKEASAYEFERPTNLPEGVKYDGERAEKFKGVAHKLGLTPAQAKGIHDFAMGDAAEGMQRLVSDIAARSEAAETALEAAWGKQGTDKHSENVRLANVAIARNGGNELVQELKDVGALGPKGEILSPKLAVMLATMGRTYREDDFHTGGGPAGKNPFAKTSEDLAAQGRLIQLAEADPSRRGEIAAMMANAGTSPKAYHLNW